MCCPHPIAILSPSHGGPASPQLWCSQLGNKSRDVGGNPSGGSQEATEGGVQKCVTPLAEPGVGKGARGVGFGPGSILVSR